MAKRASGNVTVRMSFDGTRYVCCVSCYAYGEKPTHQTVHVTPPSFFPLAVDSSLAYDGVARAAIAFAKVTDAAEYDKDQIHVRRVR